jgi:hypothetical protein
MSVYVGIDVHRKRSQLAVIDATGEVLANRNVPNGVEPILAEHLQRRAGVQPGKVGEGLRKLGRGEVFEQPDAAVAGERAPGFGERLCGERENPLGVRQELLARPGRRDARRRPVKQPMADGALELAQLLAERGLGMAERRRGAADAARPHGGDERPQQRGLKIPGHKHSLCQLQQINHFP